jgi:hypothetical protein
MTDIELIELAEEVDPADAGLVHMYYANGASAL